MNLSAPKRFHEKATLLPAHPIDPISEKLSWKNMCFECIPKLPADNGCNNFRIIPFSSPKNLHQTKERIDMMQSPICHMFFWMPFSKRFPFRISFFCSQWHARRWKFSKSTVCGIVFNFVSKLTISASNGKYFL